jgi:phosphoglycolate phosphatase
MKAIIFDFDGVIHDTFELTYRIHVLLNPDSSREDYRSYFDGNFFKKFKKSFNLSSQKRFRKLEFEAYKELKLEKDIEKGLRKLSENYDLYIITSNSIKNLNLYFKNSSFTGIFRDILSEESHKSKVEKFKLLFSKYDLGPKECIFITDTLGDILEANKIGVKSIAVDFGYHDKERLKRGAPHKIISNLSEVQDIIAELE